MATLAAVMTGQSTSAIATIQVIGDEAKTIVGRLFKPFNKNPQPLEPGVILIGTLIDNETSIDQIVLGCEAPQILSLHCHGNPLMTEIIMALLQRHGATLVRPRQLHLALLNQPRPMSTPIIETRLALQKVKTLLGAQLLNRQLNGGLTQWAQQWLSCSSISMPQFTAECHLILERSGPAHYCLYGCTLVLAGPPNVGKSTLLNSLTGQDKAIVTDIKGTTRDWVKATLCTDRLYMKLIDTAGLDTTLLNEDTDHPEKASQAQTLQVLDSADLILLVLDQSQPVDQLEPQWRCRLENRQILIVLNKSDLPGSLKVTKLPFSTDETILISAKNEIGLESLVARIETLLGIHDINPEEPICLAGRQTQLIKILADGTEEQTAKQLLNDLLHSDLNTEK